METRYKLRMYSMVMYQLRGIQVGIQALHANDAFANKYETLDPAIYKQYLNWRREDMTQIILNAGSSSTFENIVEMLRVKEVPFALFEEEDLYGKAFALSFLVDERVWNKKDYPDDKAYSDYLYQFQEIAKAKDSLVRMGDYEQAGELKEQEKALKVVAEPVFQMWSDKMGTLQNVFLREYLKGFSLHQG